MFELGHVRRLLDAFEASTWDEVQLSRDGAQVHISASGPPASTPPAAPPAASAAPAVQERRTPPTSSPPPALEGEGGAAGGEPADAAPPTAPVAAPAPAPTAEGTLVTSPSLGIFWRSPAPGEPPFVDIGQQVEADSTVCIVEVMKLMNQVLAGVSGTVREILVENGAPVERGQPLLVVEPDR